MPYYGLPISYVSVVRYCTYLMMYSQIYLDHYLINICIA